MYTGEKSAFPCTDCVPEIAASSFLCVQKVVFFHLWNIEEAT